MSGRLPRILHCSAHLDKGGAERQLRLLLGALDPARFESTVLCLAEDRETPLPAPVERLALPYGGRRDVVGLARRVRRAVLEYRPDLLHLWLPEIVTVPAALAGRRLGVPIVSGHRRSMRAMTRPAQWARHRLVYLQHGLADRVVSNFSVDAEPWLLRLLFRRRSGIVIANGIEPPRSTAGAAEAGGPRLWFVGRFSVQKRIELLVDAFGELRDAGLDVSLVLCGKGPPRYEAVIDDRVRRRGHGDRVERLGHRPDWLALVSPERDVVVLPSVSEGMSNVLLEALAAGLPTVAAAIPENRAFARHGQDAWLVEPGSRPALTAGLLAVLSDIDLRRRLAANGPRVAERFPVSRMVAAYEEVYDSMLAPLAST